MFVMPMGTAEGVERYHMRGTNKKKPLSSTAFLAKQGVNCRRV